VATCLEREGQSVVFERHIAFERRLVGVLEEVVRAVVLGGPVLVGVDPGAGQGVPHPTAVWSVREAVVHRFADGRQHAVCRAPKFKIRN